MRSGVSDQCGSGLTNDMDSDVGEWFAECGVGFVVMKYSNSRYLGIGKGIAYLITPPRWMASAWAIRFKTDKFFQR